MTIKIAIDCMGGDHGPAVTIAAAVSFARQTSDCALLLVGRQDAIEAELKKHKAAGLPQLSVVHASEVVEMDDALEVALRRKKDSSMRIAIEQVKSGQADAAVSAGNTGALMAISRYVLKTLSGVDRPAIWKAPSGPRSACSTSAPRTSRATKWSRPPRSCCAPTTSAAC
jgi:glycerol-3-phosphate acyltransferase PlsX